MSRRISAVAVAGAAVAAGLLATPGAATAGPAASARHSQPACVQSYAPPANTGDDPFGVTHGPGGTWYGDGTTINKIDDHGVTTTYTVPGVDDSAYPGVGWLTYDGHGTIWFAIRSDGRLGTIDARGTIHTIQVPAGANGAAVPQGIVVHPGHDVWFTDQANNRIGHLTLATGAFAFYPVPSAFPLGLLQARDGDLYFTERSVDKVARLDPRTGLFTEWTLPAGSFPNRLASTPDGSVWFTALFGGYVARIHDGLLTMFPVSGGPVGLTYYDHHLWAALFTDGGLAEISLHGTVVHTWAIADQTLQVAASDGRLWLTGTSMWSVRPGCMPTGTS